MKYQAKSNVLVNLINVKRIFLILKTEYTNR